MIITEMTGSPKNGTGLNDIQPYLWQRENLFKKKIKNFSRYMKINCTSCLIDSKNSPYTEELSH